MVDGRMLKACEAIEQIGDHRVKMPNDEQSEVLIDELIVALRDDPVNIDHLYRLGRAYESLGRLKDALVQFETIVQLAPDDHESLHAVGELHLKLGDSDKAISALQRATELWCDQPEYFADLGDALYSNGDVEKARYTYEKALSLTLPNEEVADRVRIALNRL